MIGRIVSVLTGLLFVSCALSSQAEILSEKELCKFYLDVVEEAVDVFEPLWVDDSERVPNAGFFDFRKYGNWMDEPYATIIIIPGNGMVSYCYSVLLSETNKKNFSAKKVPRERLLQHAIQSIRWCCLTSVYVDHPYPYLPNTRPEFLEGPFWRRQHSYRADEVGWLTMAAAVLWDELDAETRKLVESVMIGGAPNERIVQTWYSPQGGNHDQVKQDLSSTMGAAFLFPNRADRDLYQKVISGNGIDLVSTEHDFANQSVVGGMKIAEWAKGWNLYPDYSSDHHGWCNLWYGGDMLFEGRSYVELLGAICNTLVPETFTYPGNGYRGVMEWLKVLCLPQGEPASVHGNEYDAYYGAGLLGFCYGAIIEQDPVAAAMEQKAARLLQQHSRAIRQYDYHRNSWAKAATAYLMHKYRGPSVLPVTFTEAWSANNGTYYFQSHQNVIHHTNDRWASFSWGSISSISDSYYLRRGQGLCGFIVPAEIYDDFLEPLVYFHHRSLIGDIEVKDATGQVHPLKLEPIITVDRDDRSMSTAGLICDEILDRYYAFFTYEGGPTVLVTRMVGTGEGTLTWSGVPIYFYVRKGLTGERTLRCEEADVPLSATTTLQSNWWCVDEKIGFVQLGGNQSLHIEQGYGNNWARQKEYLDRCDGVFASPVANQLIQKDREMVNDISLIYVKTPSSQLQAIAESADQLRLDVPDGWIGTIAPKAETGVPCFLSLVNFDSDVTSAMISIATECGVPVFPHLMTIEGGRGNLPVQLEPLHTLSSSSLFSIDVVDNGGIRVESCGFNRYRFIPLSGKSTSFQIRWVDHSIGRIRLLEEDLGLMQEFDPTDRKRVNETIRIDRVTVIELVSSEKDTIAPAVEIAHVAVRPDYRVSIDAIADDRSGIGKIELFRDGILIGTMTQRPYVCYDRPESGYHTYQAVAWDNSENRNRRHSYKRTVRVGPESKN